MSHDESLIITNITSSPARRKVQNIFEDQIPDADCSLLKKKNYGAVAKLRKGQVTMFAYGQPNPDAVIVNRVFETA